MYLYKSIGIQCFLYTNTGIRFIFICKYSVKCILINKYRYKMYFLNSFSNLKSYFFSLKLHVKKENLKIPSPLPAMLFCHVQENPALSQCCQQKPIWT